MKNLERLRESYEIQKRIFDEAEQRRIRNCKKQKEELQSKITKINVEIEKLDQRIQHPREFESFDSFRRKAETLSN